MTSRLKMVFLRFVRRLVVQSLNKIDARSRIDILFDSFNLDSTESFTYEVHAPNLTKSPFFSDLGSSDLSAIVGNPDTTIIMQGPIDHKANFTKNSILHYLNTYPHTRLILSTWENEDVSAFQAMQSDLDYAERFQIVQSSKPKYEGISNINLQIVSTQNGIACAKENRSKYLLKTRTDQCMYSMLSLQYLESLLTKHPREGGGYRILSASRGTFLLRPYGLSDMVTFGTFEDVSNYWDVELDDRAMSNLPFPETSTLRQEGINAVCEVYLAKKYLKFLGVELNDTLKQSLELYRDYFLIADYQVLDLVWNKYTYRMNKWSHLNFPIRHQELTHFLWQDLQSNLHSYVPLEVFMDREGNF